MGETRARTAIATSFPLLSAAHPPHPVSATRQAPSPLPRAGGLSTANESRRWLRVLLGKSSTLPVPATTLAGNWNPVAAPATRVIQRQLAWVEWPTGIIAGKLALSILLAIGHLDDLPLTPPHFPL